jgi:hypothetical protein
MSGGVLRNLRTHAFESSVPMTGDCQTERRPSPALKIAAALALLGAIGGAVVLLERDRSRQLTADEVRIWRTEDDTIRGVQFIGPEVTEAHWQQVAGVTSIRSITLNGTTRVAGGLSWVAEFPELRTLDLGGCGWVNDHEIVKLINSGGLQSLTISGTGVTEAGLRQLDLLQLQTFTAEKCPGLGEEALVLLAELDSPKVVRMNGQAISLDVFEQVRDARRDLVLQVPVEDPRRRPPPEPRRPYAGHWFDGDTDVDAFIRFERLPHDWSSGRWKPDVVVEHLAVSGPAVEQVLPKLLAAFDDLDYLRLTHTHLKGGLDRIPTGIKDIFLLELAPDSRFAGLETVHELRRFHVEQNEEPLSATGTQQILDVVAGSTSLETLSLTGLDIPKGELRLPLTLQSLWLTNCRIDDADLLKIGNLSSLERLSIHEIAIHDPVAEQLLDMPNLHDVRLYETGVSQEMAQRLQQRYPDSNVTIR